MFELKKIGFVKRASAWLLDAILLSVLAVGFMWIISLIGDFGGAQAKAAELNKAWDDFRATYVADVAAHYGFTYTETEGGGYTIEKDGEPATLNDVMNMLTSSNGQDGETAEAYAAYQTLPPADQVNRQVEYVYNLLFMMVSLGLFLGYLCLEFIVPVCLKNGQTVGKKVFGICLVRPNCVKVSSVAVFGRAILGKYAIETMFPVFLVFLFFFGGLGWLAIALFVALILLDAILLFATKNKTPIHDILAYTVVADMKVQMIYSSDEELAEKKALAEKERVEGLKSV